MLAQEAQVVFGSGFVGKAFFYLLQLATMLILYTGANTSFNGFPFLTSYVAGRLVPAPVAAQARPPAGVLQRDHPADDRVRGAAHHRGRRRQPPGPAVRDRRVHRVLHGRLRHGQVPQQAQEPGWRRRQVINFSAGVMTAIVVAVFAVVKFTEGAWVVLVLFAILVPALIRMNREYSAEGEVLETISENQPPPPPHYSRRTVFVFVDGFDLATLAALRYARSLRPTSIRAVHFVIDSVRADKLREKWTRADRGVTLDFIDVSDRRLLRAAAELVEREIADPGTHVTVVLPRRSYSALLGRLLHDRTADKIAAVVSRIPRSAATIIPYDVESRVRVLQERHAATIAAESADVADQQIRTEAAEVADKHATPNGDKPPAQGPRPAQAARTGAVRARRPAAGGAVAGRRRHADRLADRSGAGRRGGQDPGGRDQAGGAELGAGLRDLGRNGHADRPVLRPLAHPGHRVRRAGAVQGLGRHQGRPSGDDQPGLRADLPGGVAPAG